MGYSSTSRTNTETQGAGFSPNKTRTLMRVFLLTGIQTLIVHLVLHTHGSQGRTQRCTQDLSGAHPVVHPGPLKGTPRTSQGYPQGCTQDLSGAHPVVHPGPLKGTPRTSQGRTQGCTQDLSGMHPEPLRDAPRGAPTTSQGCTHDLSGCTQGCTHDLSRVHPGPLRVHPEPLRVHPEPLRVHPGVHPGPAPGRTQNLSGVYAVPHRGTVTTSPALIATGAKSRPLVKEYKHACGSSPCIPVFSSRQRLLMIHGVSKALIRRASWGTDSYGPTCSITDQWENTHRSSLAPNKTHTHTHTHTHTQKRTMQAL